MIYVKKDVNRTVSEHIFVFMGIELFCGLLWRNFNSVLNIKDRGSFRLDATQLYFSEPKILS